MRSVAFGVAGFFVVGALQASGAIPAIYRDTLAPVSGMVSAFLMALALSVAYYHKRWMLGVGGAALFLILPFVTNLSCVRISGRSLIYPTIVVGLLGVCCLRETHRKISGTRWEDPLDEELRHLMADLDSKLLGWIESWVDRVTWLCFAGGAIILLILFLR